MKHILLPLLLLLTPVGSWGQPASTSTAIDGSWKGTLKLGQAQLTIVFNIDAGSREVKMDVPEQGAKAIPMEVGYLSADSVSLSCRAIGMSYQGHLVDGAIEGTFQQGALQRPLTFEKGTVEQRRPQTPAAPYPYATKEVTFKNAKADVTLSGTLTYPVDFKAGECPVVLMVTGSGAQNRDEEIMGHKPFLVLADFLARNGIASLRYDDRGTNQSTGDFTAATTIDFADDAAAGLEWLRKTKEFSSVGILGHSEGGLIAYVLGSRQLPDFIVSLAGVACPVDTLMMQQLNGIAKVQGAPQNVVSTVQQARTMLLSMDKKPWMKAFLDLPVVDYVAATACPVFAASGEKDLNVPPSLTMQYLNRYLPKNKHNLLKVYPGLNHTFQHAATGNPLEIANIEETFAEEVMRDIVAWIKGL